MSGVKTGQRVLLVDSDAIDRGTSASALREAGYAVVETGSFDRARALLLSYEPHLLITDIRLGAFNGLQLLWGRSLEQAAIPAIVTNAYPDAVLESEARMLGCPFLVKPLRARSLLRMVDSLLSTDRWASVELRDWRRTKVLEPVEITLGKGPRHGGGHQLWRLPASGREGQRLVPLDSSKGSSQDLGPTVRRDDSGRPGLEDVNRCWRRPWCGCSWQRGRNPGLEKFCRPRSRRLRRCGCASSL